MERTCFQGICLLGDIAGAHLHVCFLSYNHVIAFSFSLSVVKLRNLNLIYILGRCDSLYVIQVSVL